MSNINLGPLANFFKQVVQDYQKYWITFGKFIFSDEEKDLFLKILNISVNEISVINKSGKIKRFFKYIARILFKSPYQYVVVRIITSSSNLEIEFSDTEKKIIKSDFVNLITSKTKADSEEEISLLSKVFVLKMFMLNKKKLTSDKILEKIEEIRAILNEVESKPIDNIFKDLNNLFIEKK